MKIYLSIYNTSGNAIKKHELKYKLPTNDKLTKIISVGSGVTQAPLSYGTKPNLLRLMNIQALVDNR
ncbi:ASN_collapsed_G0051470.mRNA.1.CDS.1 [Saccharomyces cerevisiae]|nr:ASN_collapsed_G0051470.mRNA.1.CDS.1 [Saccharomyces cerevisiae]